MVAPIPGHAFFEKSEFERLLRHNFLQFASFATKVFYFIRRRSTRCIARQLPFALCRGTQTDGVRFDALWSEQGIPILASVSLPSSHFAPHHLFWPKLRA